MKEGADSRYCLRIDHLCLWFGVEELANFSFSHMFILRFRSLPFLLATEHKTDGSERMSQ